MNRSIEYAAGAGLHPAPASASSYPVFGYPPTVPPTEGDRVTIAPTVGGRILALDVLRGFAVLGILFANIGAFAGPQTTEASSLNRPPLSGLDAWIDVLTTAFVTGKFR